MNILLLNSIGKKISNRGSSELKRRTLLVY